MFEDIGSTALLVYMVIMNIIAFVAFGADKARAQKGAWRIPEKTLMLLAIIGGSIGAYAGMRVFHHKTKKPLFKYGVPIVLVVHLVILTQLISR